MTRALDLIIVLALELLAVGRGARLNRPRRYYRAFDDWLDEFCEAVVLNYGDRMMPEDREFFRRQWRSKAEALHISATRGAVEDRDALAVMLKRLLDVALVDGYGEQVAEEAGALLDRLGGQ